MRPVAQTFDLVRLQVAVNQIRGRPEAEASHLRGLNSGSAFGDQEHSLNPPEEARLEGLS